MAISDVCVKIHCQFYFSCPECVISGTKWLDPPCVPRLCLFQVLKKDWLLRLFKGEDHSSSLERSLRTNSRSKYKSQSKSVDKVKDGQSNLMELVLRHDESCPRTFSDLHKFTQVLHAGQNWWIFLSIKKLHISAIWRPFIEYLKRSP